MRLRLSPTIPFTSRQFATALCLVCLYAVTGMAQVTPSPATTELQLGEAALRAKDNEAAAQHFAKALALDPTSSEAHADLGAINFFRGNCATAEPDLRAALSRMPTLSKVQALLAICEDRAHMPSALPDMQAAFNTLEDPNLRLQLGMELANGYYQAAELGRTANVLQELLTLSPDNVDILFFAQRVYSALAENTLNKLAILSPGSGRMEQLIAERLINAGDLKDAIRHYRTALQLSPKLPGMHFELAEALVQEAPNDPESQKRALTELNAAQAVDGDTAKVEVEFGKITLAQADYEDAMKHFRRAYQLDPSNVQAQIGLADLYRQNQKPSEAAAYLRNAERLDPLEPSTHYKLSQIDRQLHDDEESKKELHLFQELRATQDQIKALYQQMTPQTAGERSSP